MRFFVLPLCATLALNPVPAWAGCARDAMLVLDGSASMAELGFDTQQPTRIEEARIAVRRAAPQIAPVRRLGLLVYGPGGTDACSGINLHFAPVENAAKSLIDGVESVRPAGLTALAASVQAAAEVLQYRTQPAIVVLVTDGNETCGGRPCALGDALAAQGRDLTVHVIGFKVVSDFFSWDSPEAHTYTEGETVAKCLADRTGGLFVSTQTVDELTEALRVTLGCALIGLGRGYPENQRQG